MYQSWLLKALASIVFQKVHHEVHHPCVCILLLKKTQHSIYDLDALIFLLRVHGLEVQLEPLCEVDHDDLPVDLLKQLTSDLGVIKVNLDACHNCWDDLNHLHSQPCVQHRGLFVSTFTLQPLLVLSKLWMVS